MGVFVQAAKSYQKADRRFREDQAREAELAERQADRESDRHRQAITTAALLASLGEQGIAPNEQMPTVRTPSAPGIPSMRIPTARRLGDTGYSQDLTRTPQARAIAEQHRQAETIRRRKLVLKARVPELKDADDAVLEEYATNDTLFKNALAFRDGGAAVNWVTRNDGMGGVVQIHPRTGAVRKVPGVSSRRAGGSATTTDPRTSGQKTALGAVQQQLTEARSDYNSAQSRAGTRPAFFRTPADSVAYSRAATEADRLKQRVDSLGGVRDRLSVEVQGDAGRTARGEAPPAQLPPLTPAQKARAEAEPDYKEFLREKGYRI